MKINSLKKIFCLHNELTFIENLHGDKINFYSDKRITARSLWQCDKCGKIIRKSYLKKS